MTTATATTRHVSAAPKVGQGVIGAEQSFSFGPYQLIPHRRLLLKAGQPLQIGSRALDVLIALVERAGETVSKNELVARVWPKVFIEQGNLRVHVAAMRKTLGDTDATSRYVVTIPGRGYCF